MARLGKSNHQNSECSRTQLLQVYEECTALTNPLHHIPERDIYPRGLETATTEFCQ